MLDIGPSAGNQLFTAVYPQYPNSKTLTINPSLPVEEKFYSTNNDNSRTASNESDYSCHNDSNSDKSDNTDNSSYV